MWVESSMKVSMIDLKEKREELIDIMIKRPENTICFKLPFWFNDMPDEQLKGAIKIIDHILIIGVPEKNEK